MTDDAPSPLDRLYQLLGDAHGIEGDLEQQRKVLREQITTREEGLQHARTVAEAAGDTPQVQQIDAELDELRRAWGTLTDDDEDTVASHPERAGHQDQRRGDGDDPGIGA